MSLCVRLAVLEDADSIVKIDSQCFSEPISLDGAIRMIQDPNMMVRVLCTDDGIVSYCSAMKVLDEIQIVNVATAPGHTGKGYGFFLLSNIFQEAKEKGIITASLEVRVSNFGAIHLYEKLGFCRCGIRKGFYRKPTEDAIVMILSLTP